MHLRLIGLLLIGLILLTVMGAFIFSEKFRKDVIASEGEAAVLGLINVKGVIIVLLVAVFGGLFAFILQMDDASSGSATLSTSAAIAHLKATPDAHYSLVYQNDGYQLLINDEAVGALSLPLEVDKSDTDNREWEVSSHGHPLEGFVLKGEGGYLQWDERDSTSRDAYYTGEAYKLKNLDLWLRIDSIVNVQEQRRTTYKYYLRYGEGDTRTNITWRPVSEVYHKTPDGHIYINDEFRPIRHAGWTSDYFVKFGAGQPSTANPQLTSVEKINAIAVGLRLEK